jgi:hypothetical protein
MSNQKRIPKRIQRKRAKGWRMPENTVYVGRPTNLGSPFKVVKCGKGWQVSFSGLLDISGAYFDNKVGAVAWSVAAFRDHVKENEACYKAELAKVEGKDLACWCSLYSPCHADVLIELLGKE